MPKMFLIRDTKADACEHPPFFMVSRGAALREWSSLANDEKTMFCRHPGDFCLMEIGDFDSQTGKVSVYDVPVSLGLALDFKKPAEADAPLLAAINGQKAE